MLAVSTDEVKKDRDLKTQKARQWRALNGGGKRT